MPGLLRLCTSDLSRSRFGVIARVFFLVASGVVWSQARSAANDASVRVHMWFKAFIPREHPTLPEYFTRTELGTWVVRAPNIPMPRGFDISRLQGTCFETDNRGFEPSPGAPARVSVELNLVINDRSMRVEPPVGRPEINIGSTHNVDCRSGEELQPPRQAPPSSVSISEVKSLNFLRTVGIKASAADPFYTFLRINVAPRLDFDIVIQYDILGRKIKVSGDTGIFPSFEGYYQIGAGRVMTIVQLDLSKDATALSLFDFGTGVNMRNFELDIGVRP